MNPLEKKKLSVILITTILVVLLDQLSKILIVKGIIPLSYLLNTGAGFGILKNSTALLIWISIIVIGLILYYYEKVPVKLKSVQIATALILAGAIGNLIDRIRLGHVIDFINLRIWPSFNIADSAITIGAILLIIYLVKEK